MLGRTLPLTLTLFLNACSGNYIVGTEDDDTATDSSDDETEIPMGTGGAQTPGPSFGGGPSMIPPGMGGAAGANPAGPGMNPQGGGMSMPQPPDPATTCDASGLPEDPTDVSVPATEAWARLTRFIVGEELEPDGPLPAMVTRAWLEEQAAELYAAHPEGPMFQRMLGRTGLNPDTTATYAALLHSPGASTNSLLEFRDVERNAGLLTDRDFLAQYPGISRRGAFIMNALLCTPVPESPPDIIEVMPPPVAGMTGRQALEAVLAPPQCKGCHVLVDPFGYALEHFDALGNYRTEDNGLPIDASGSVTIRQSFMFSDSKSLAEQLKASCDFSRCFTRRLLTEAVAMGRAISVESAGMFVSADDVTRIAARSYSEDESVSRIVELIASSRAFIE